MIKPRRNTLNKYIDVSLRLREQDHNFLNDLAKVGVISEDVADRYHYDELKSGSRRRLDRLVDGGILSRRMLKSDGSQLAVYEFKDKKIASLWRGDISHIGAKRTLKHELIVSKLYFDCGRPDDFRVASRFTQQDKKCMGHLDSVMPDGMFTDLNGERVFVEADSGQYTKSQIQQKTTAWRGVKQVWGQPLNSFHKMTMSSATVFRY